MESPEMVEYARGQRAGWPIHGWIGIALVAVSWTLNWSLSGLRTHWGFFPLWLGYAITVDALVFYRKGHSLMSRSPAAYAGLFLASVPAWWLFELINLRTQNWFYLGAEAFTDLEYAVLSSVSFSTVIPSVFGTAELMGTLGWLRRLRRGPVITPTPAVLRGMAASGVLMLILLIAWPALFFPLVWGAAYCLIEPLNARLGYRSLFDDLARGDWRPIIALGMGALICGFFWEMWNFFSYPKWIYRIPYADWVPLFEMPLAGYLGYLPFSLELFALYHMIMGLLLPKSHRQYVRLTDEDA